MVGDIRDQIIWLALSQLLLHKVGTSLQVMLIHRIPNIKFSLAAAIQLSYINHRGVCAQIRAPTNRPVPKSTHKSMPKPMPKKTNKPKTSKVSTLISTMKPTQTHLQLWRQVEFDIVDGEAKYEGSAVSLSADSKILVIGEFDFGQKNSWLNDGKNGNVCVYA